MKKKLFLIPALCIAGFAHAQSIGPSILNSAGGKGTIGANTFEYSIGEMAVVSTNTAASITVTHGVLQPIPKNADAINDVAFAKLNFNIYPNPASTDVNISIKHTDIDINGIQLYDVSGKLIFNNTDPILKNGMFTLPINIYANGNYVLRILSKHQGNMHQSNFTILKN
jgi:Secretion system C-terminal sorting domain